MNKEKAKLITECPELRQRLFLIKNGIPFDVAFSLDDDAVFAYCIIFSESDRDPKYGFNWDTMKFNEPSTS